MALLKLVLGRAMDLFFLLRSSTPHCSCLWRPLSRMGGEDGTSPLHLAAKSGELEVVEAGQQCDHRWGGRM